MSETLRDKLIAFYKKQKTAKEPYHGDYIFISQKWKSMVAAGKRPTLTQ